MFIRRVIFGKQKAGLVNQGQAIADAGPDQDILNTESASLDGSSSSSTEGNITSYAWSYISGTGFSIDDPDSAVSPLSGVPTVGDHIFQLTVQDDLGNVDSDTVMITVNPESGSIMTIESTEDTLTLSGGDANETITLAFSLYSENFPDAAYFTGVNFPGGLNYSNPNAAVQIQLDGQGNFSSFLTSQGSDFHVEVKVTVRSSGKAIPNPDRVTFDVLGTQ